MAIQVGYACLALGVPGSAQKSCTLRTATPQKLCEVNGANLAALQQLVWYNAANGIKVFRISSDLIPFGSSPANTLPWQQQFAPQFAQLASEIAKAGLRVFKSRPQASIVQSYGDEFAEALRQASTGVWQAMPTRDGWRAIRLESITPPKPADYETLRGVVLQDWKDATAAELRSAAVHALAKKYTLKIETAAK